MNLLAFVVTAPSMAGEISERQMLGETKEERKEKLEEDDGEGEETKAEGRGRCIRGVRGKMR